MSKSHTNVIGRDATKALPDSTTANGTSSYTAIIDRFYATGVGRTLRGWTR
jgi:hypothetical protein